MADRLLAGFIIALAVVYVYATSRLPSLDIGDPLGPKVFPYLIAALALIAAVWLIVESEAKRRLGADKPVDRGQTVHRPLAVFAVLGWMLLFYTVLERIGFILGGTIFLLGLTLYFNRGRWHMNILVSVLFPTCVYFAFARILGIWLPRGILPF
jgi:putative tricarboxylic transport membrane protein